MRVYRRDYIVDFELVSTTFFLWPMGNFFYFFFFDLENIYIEMASRDLKLQQAVVSIFSSVV